MKFFTPDRQAHEPSVVQIADKIYVDKVKLNSLYGKAFFGHKRSRSENWLLERLWNEAVKEAKKKLELRAQVEARFKNKEV